MTMHSIDSSEIFHELFWRFTLKACCNLIYMFKITFFLKRMQASQEIAANVCVQEIQLFDFFTWCTGHSFFK